MHVLQVWHILDYCCLYTIIPTAHKVFTPVEGECYIHLLNRQECQNFTVVFFPPLHSMYMYIVAFAYNPIYQCIAMGTEQLSLLRQVIPNRVRADIVQTHSHPLTSVKYSHSFNQVLSACEGSVSN